MSRRTTWPNRLARKDGTALRSRLCSLLLLERTRPASLKVSTAARRLLRAIRGRKSKSGVH